MEEELITKSINTVGDGFGPGKDNPNAMSTVPTSVYRVTGIDQIEDIIKCGYVRPKGWGARRERVGDRIYWSRGNDKLFYQDKRPVIEAPCDKVKDGQVGAIPLGDLIGIWMFDEKESKYINNIEYVKNAYMQLHNTEEETTTMHL